MTRTGLAFAALMVTQAAHSVEEYVGRLWESFPPAALLTGFISRDREVAFLMMNVGLVLFGFWCLLWPVRQRWRAATSLLWFWVVLETLNGAGHLVWTVNRGAYTPGAATAPVLLVTAAYLAYLLTHRPPVVAG